MVRRFEEPIEVRSRGGDAPAAGEVPAAGGAQATGEAQPAGAPDAFVWRGRLYVVREVLDHWQERRQWWREALDPQLPGHSARERQVWRVEASSGRMYGTGVYDLGVDPGPARWQLLRIAD